MGRAGAGGGGHRSSGGGHSVHRSSGGHRISGSSGSHSRAGSGSRMSSGGHTPPPPSYGMPRRYRYRRHYGHYGYGGATGTGSIGATIVVIILWFIIIAAVLAAVRGTGGGSSYNSFNNIKSTIVREKIETKNAYINDCIIDEIGWFNNPTKTAAALKAFWEETGVQPYIILKAYDATLKKDEQKEQWATDYYDANFDTENIFLFVYFAEKDTENDVGFMAYANGYQTSAVMDAEAMEIFWNYLDGYWTSNMTTDDMFIRTFDSTAKAIMHVSATKNDIIMWCIILAVVIVIVVAVVKVIKMIHKRAKEKAEEDARILNTPVGDITSDHLEDKYLR